MNLEKEREQLRKRLAETLAKSVGNNFSRVDVDDADTVSEEEYQKRKQTPSWQEQQRRLEEEAR